MKNTRISQSSGKKFGYTKKNDIIATNFDLLEKDEKLSNRKNKLKRL